jgi:hypothetical protein
MTKLTSLKALRPALQAVGYDCWTSVAGGGNGYRIGRRTDDGSYEVVLACGTLKAAIRKGNELLANGGLI